MSHTRRILCLAALLVAVTAALQPQVLGALKGVVRDKAEKLPLAGVKVTVIANETQTIVGEVTSDGKGAFYKSGLQPGVYQVRLDRNGFLPAALAIRVSIGETRDLLIELEAAAAMSGSAVSLLEQGIEQLKQGRYADAVATFTRALEKDAENAILLYYRGQAYDRSRQWDPALADYRLAAERKSDFILPLTAMGNIFAKKLDFAAAIETFRKAIRLGTPDIVSLYNFGVCLINSGAGPEAASVFEQLLALDPNYADACYQLGIVALGQGDVAKSKALLNRFVQLDPGNANAATAREILKSLN